MSGLAVMASVGALAIACGSKGNGIGTAPEQITCPEQRPEAASPCGIVTNVCNYPGTCAAPGTIGEAHFFCSGGTAAAWQCIEQTEAGPQPDTAGDAPDGETITSDADAGETDADPDAPDSGDAAESGSDVTTDSTPDADLDALDAADSTVDPGDTSDTSGD